MQVESRLLGSHLAGLAWVALRSFVGALLVGGLAGIVLAGLSYYCLREQYWLYGASAAALALVEGVGTGVVLGAKRAVVMAMADGLGRLRLGRSLVRLVFERMLGGAEGGRVRRGLEWLPLAQADDLLSGAVRGVTGDAAEGGWLRRAVQTRLLEGVRKYTLARFRQEGAKHGGIDLVKVKEELEQTVDDALVRKVRGGLRLWTVLVAVGLPLLVAVQTWVILRLAQSRG